MGCNNCKDPSMAGTRTGVGACRVAAGAGDEGSTRDRQLLSSACSLMRSQGFLLQDPAAAADEDGESSERESLLGSTLSACQRRKGRQGRP